MLKDNPSETLAGNNRMLSENTIAADDLQELVSFAMTAAQSGPPASKPPEDAINEGGNTLPPINQRRQMPNESRLPYG